MKNACISFILSSVILLGSCRKTDSGEANPQNSLAGNTENLVISGEDEEIDQEIVKKGKVLIAYSNCYECHREKTKAIGPPFQDIAKRYPFQQVYLEHLARKIIAGGSGAWGYLVMEGHPHMKFEEAKIMAAYILSLKEKTKKPWNKD